jgi:hypothetical protein
MSDVLPVDTTITIRAETSFPDPDTCKFTLSRMVAPDRAAVRDSRCDCPSPSSGAWTRFMCEPHKSMQARSLAVGMGLKSRVE